MQNGLVFDLLYLNQPLFFRLLCYMFFLLPMDCLLLQSDKKDLGPISRAANSALVILEEIDVNSTQLKSFKQYEDIIERGVQ